MEPEQLLFASVFVIGMFAGVFVIFLAMRQRALQMEMQHRERMAMIERGQVPQDPPRVYAVSPAGRAGGLRSITLGIIVMSIGLGLMSLISLAAESPEIGVGLGGAICILGGGLIAAGMLRRTQGAQWATESPAPPPPADRREP